jgi:uncharacterized protein related to proFAR isomerase
MTFQVSERQFATSRPDDLDDRLVATTGCTAAELSEMLGRSGNPLLIARAIQPMLVDDVTVADLAAALSNADLGDAIRQARALLAPAAVGEHGGVSA